MYILGRTQMLSTLSYEDCLKTFHELGFDGAEVSVLNKEFQVREEIFSPKTLQSIRAAAEKYDLKYLSASCHMDYVNDSEKMETVKRALSVAREIGSSILIINGAFKQASTPAEEEEEWDKTIQKTIELCQAAEDEGITLAMEFEPGFVVASTQQLLKLFDEVNSPQLMANLDLGHAFLCDPNPLESIRHLSAKIAHCHIENMKAGIHDHLIPQEGDMDLGAYIAQLKSVGFDGGMALDLYKYDYQEVSAASSAYLKSLL